MLSIQERIKNFQSALKDERIVEINIVNRYISEGIPFIFQHCEQNYTKLKEKIANYFDIPLKDVFMIGSAKMGFSIAPMKLWKEFNDESDIDMVIVSNQLFDSFWEELHNFNISIQTRSERENKIYYSFLEYFFKGWLRPDLFPFDFKGKDGWFNFFRSISYQNVDGRKVTGAIFKNQSFFNSYHCDNIKRLKGGI